MNSYRVIGIMSGTSLDGIDLAYCLFTKDKEHWNYQIEIAETVPYSAEWIRRLMNLPVASALEYAQTHADYGHYIGRVAANFIQKHQLDVDFISSHGHTIFHQPALGFTAQIGDGASIVAETGLDVVCDFRSLDVALQGQGAPLVPIGDRLLFSEFDYRLNLGGFSNISFEENNKTLAFDIAPANLAFNYFSQKLGHSFDAGGQLAAQGILIDPLLQKLNSLPYYQLKGSKSLGREWFETEFTPRIDESYPTLDILNTLSHHLADQISNVLNQNSSEKGKARSMLITGGGVYNSYLISLLKEKTKVKLVIPSDLHIQFKEALIFAFLGVLRLQQKANVLADVTGSRQNNIGGAIYKS